MRLKSHSLVNIYQSKSFLYKSWQNLFYFNPVQQRCTVKNCHGLLRPNVVLFKESINPHLIKTIYKVLDECDLFIIVN